MNKIWNKLKILYWVIKGQSIVMVRQDNKLVIDAGNYEPQYIKEVACQFFKSAYLLENNTK